MAKLKAINQKPQPNLGSHCSARCGRNGFASKKDNVWEEGCQHANVEIFKGSFGGKTYDLKAAFPSNYTYWYLMGLVAIP